MTLSFDGWQIIWQLATLAFIAGGGWMGLRLTMRFQERKQDIRLKALEDKMAAELEALNKALVAHVERYEREHGDLRNKVDGKGEGLTTVTEQLKQVEKRLDEKLDLMMQVFDEKLLAAVAHMGAEERPRRRRRRRATVAQMPAERTAKKRPASGSKSRRAS